MKTRIFILIFSSLTLLSTPTLRADDKCYRLSQAVLVGGTFADWQSSAGLREVGPMATNSRGGQAAMMAATSGLTYLISHHLLYKTGHRKAAKIMNAVVGGMHFSAAAWNWKEKAR